MNTEKSPSESLNDLLNGLCSTEEDKEILRALCASVQTFTENAVEFSDEDEEREFEYTKGGTIKPQSHLPKSFAEIAEVVSSLTWDAGGPEAGFSLTDDGHSGSDLCLFGEVEEDDAHVADIAKSGGPSEAFEYGQNELFFDPSRKLNNGEDALGFISHEECEIVQVTSVDHLDYKQIFLRLISDGMIGTDYIDEIYC